uniref:Uncharacterized protein n=1 Tax=Roseihalotalea indica TaxID=2867963 RepID=A0AA49JBV7_9BACT|nr:hypothetical protein K4G66_21970 [Tunicatimonas sp. TK19036]
MTGEKEQKTGFEYANQEHFYGDYPTAYIDAKYKDGKFVYLEDQQEVILQDRAIVRLVVYRKDIPEEMRERFHSTSKKVLDKGSRLYFRLPNTRLTFFVGLLEDLLFIKAGNKPARVINARCEVYDVKGPTTQKFEPFEVDSLNQAYFQASVRYRQDARSHTGNIYDKFYILDTDRSLSTLRF